MAEIGLHIRLKQSIFDVAAYAASLQLPLFQCFFIHQETNQFIMITDEEVQQFEREWRDKFTQLYVHGSYWINLASAHAGTRIILRELELAKKLNFTHIIVHPGSAKKIKDKREGIITIAKNLNKILKTENQIKIVLENTAHAGLSIGGDLHDFALLREHLEHPEKVLYCIDTAHAYVYGYDVSNEKGQLHFLELVDKTMGLANIALIHLNDTKQLLGSRIDRHEIVGNGILNDSLKLFVHQSALQHIPIIMELPVIPEEEEKRILEMVRSW